MPNYQKYLMRHGESWIQGIIEQIERNEGIRIGNHYSLEERWQMLMRKSPLNQSSEAA